MVIRGFPGLLSSGHSPRAEYCISKLLVSSSAVKNFLVVSSISKLFGNLNQIFGFKFLKFKFVFNTDLSFFNFYLFLQTLEPAPAVEVSLETLTLLPILLGVPLALFLAQLVLLLLQLAQLLSLM